MTIDKITSFLLICTFLQINAQVGIGTTTPDGSAVLDVESTEKGFLPPRMTTANRNIITNPAEGLIIYNKDTHRIEFYNGNSWIDLIDGIVLATPTPTITSGSCQGEPEFFTFDNLEYRPVESGPANGKRCWLDRNLGASQVATSSTDENAYGDLYQWGRAADGHQLRSNTCMGDCFDGATTRPNTITETGAWNGKFITISDINRNDWVTNQTDDAWNSGTEGSPVKATTDPCPTGYRVPTKTEWDAERLSWAPNDGAIDSPLKLPMAGSRLRGTGGFFMTGSRGRYWSSSISGVKSEFFDFGSSGGGFSTDDRADGLTVRCIKD